MNCEIDGKLLPVEQPASVGELRQHVREAAARGDAIYPVGGRTMLDFGLPPARDGIALETTRLDRVIDYPSRDMTITVEAGIRVAKLQQILRAEGQRLPVDVPRAAEATLGGAIATNTSGPRRYGLGTLRDYVIGISVVDAEGNETKAGGRVVKNVAGYDLCKLYTGSLGTLGIITQVTLKLRPIPESSAIDWIMFKQDEQVVAALDSLAVSRTRPTAIELLNPAAAKHVAQQIGTQYSVLSTQYSPGAGPKSGTPTGCVLVFGFEESADAVKWQQRQLAQELSDVSASIQHIEGPDAERLWAGLIEFQATDFGGNVTFKADFRSSAAAQFFDVASRQPVRWAIQVHAGNGIAFGHALPPAERSAIEASVVDLRSLAVSLRGNLVLRRCPTEWKLRLPVWGEPRADVWLMHAIKQKLDPQNILNPGRFLCDPSSHHAPS